MTWFDANFGAQKAGLGTVGYREVNNVGGDAVARTGAGVVDAGDGMYGKELTPNAATVSLQWDTGEAVPVFAVESIDQLNGVEAKVDLVLVDTGQLLLDVAALNAQNVLILLDTAAIIAQNGLILADTSTIIAQNILILADTAQLLLDVATVDGVVDQILLDTTQLLLDTIALAAQNVLIFADTQMLRDIEDGHDIREILRLITASANNVLAGAESGSTQITLRKLNGTGVRQLTNVDDDGNRLSIVSRDFSP